MKPPRRSLRAALSASGVSRRKPMSLSLASRDSSARIVGVGLGVIARTERSTDTESIADRQQAISSGRCPVRESGYKMIAGEI